MSAGQRAHLAACAGVIAYALAYVVTDYAKLPRLTYDQLGRAWHMGPVHAWLSSGYVGLWLWALAAGLLAAGLTYALLRFRKEAVPERTLGLALAWAATAMVVGLGYYTWHNWP